MIATIMKAMALTICVLVHSAHAQTIDELLVPPTPAEAEDIKEWIPERCCRTQSCCRKVRPEALAGIPGDRLNYYVVATGQLIARTDWSRDGQTWRCTCDHIEGRWVVHLKARTHCIFPVPNGY